ncbi:hypothetical protein [Microbulbifer sp. PAAF003]|uniref:hypothetical protein n=1 Tax=Microbulbifer sp. PAAF003 TaxID=3243375 RepID=UPI00403A27F8
MRLDLDRELLALRASAERMGDFTPDFNIEAMAAAEFSLDTELERGKEISLDELATDNGLLSIEGRQVLLYIPDHGVGIIEAQLNPVLGGSFMSRIVERCKRCDGKAVWNAIKSQITFPVFLRFTVLTQVVGR